MNTEKKGNPGCDNWLLRPGSAGDHAGKSCFYGHGLMNEHKWLLRPGSAGDHARVTGGGGQYAN